MMIFLGRIKDCFWWRTRSKVQFIDINKGFSQKSSIW